MTTTPILHEISHATLPGHADYGATRDAMAVRVAAIRQGIEPPTLWFLEHPPLYTAGTSAKLDELFNPRGYPVFDAGRGGQWTFHGPGQRIVYLMLDLLAPPPLLAPRDVRAYVGYLERWIVASLARLKITAFTREGRVGVWAVDPLTHREAKIAAIGVRISRWVTWHGIAINHNPDLEDFDGIVPCGLREFGTTSIRRFRSDLTMADLDHALQASWAEIFGGTLAQI